MWKKISLQLILLSFALFSIFYAYNTYFVKDNVIQEKKNEVTELEKKEEDKIEIIKDVIEENNKENIIKNLKYVSKDSLGNEYIIGSKYSELSTSEEDIINMREVNAEIIMLNSEPIYITSDFARYNNKNYETVFTSNVTIIYLENKITCEVFNISVENNLAHVTKDVIYENSKGKLIADTIEIDLITKNSKIFMNDENKKVIVINK